SRKAGGVAPVDPAAAALLDEDLDYRIAQRIGSLDGWRSFLTAHGSGVHAQSVREEVEKLLLAEQAPTPPGAEVSNGASTDAKAGTEVVGTENYRATKETDPEVARKNSMARHAPAYSWVTTDAAGHRWVHIRPIHYSQQE